MFAGQIQIRVISGLLGTITAFIAVIQGVASLREHRSKSLLEQREQLIEALNGTDGVCYKPANPKSFRNRLKHIDHRLAKQFTYQNLIVDMHNEETKQIRGNLFFAVVCYIGIITSAEAFKHQVGLLKWVVLLFLVTLIVSPLITLIPIALLPPSHDPISRTLLSFLFFAPLPFFYAIEHLGKGPIPWQSWTKRTLIVSVFSLIIILLSVGMNQLSIRRRCNLYYDRFGEEPPSAFCFLDWSWGPPSIFLSYAGVVAVEVMAISMYFYLIHFTIPIIKIRDLWISIFSCAGIFVIIFMIANLVTFSFSYLSKIENSFVHLIYAGNILEKDRVLFKALEDSGPINKPGTIHVERIETWRLTGKHEILYLRPSDASLLRGKSRQVRNTLSSIMHLFRCMIGRIWYGPKYPNGNVLHEFRHWIDDKIKKIKDSDTGPVPE